MRIWWCLGNLVETFQANRHVRRLERQDARPIRSGEDLLDAVVPYAEPDPVIVDAWQRQVEVGMVRPTVNRTRRAGWSRGAERAKV